jgi:hypothetical protein
MKVSLGCDPELFLVDAAGALHSAIGLIGGSKMAPRPLPLGDGYAVQEDNVAVEFNAPPAETEEAWSSSIGNTITFLEGFVKTQYGFSFGHMSAAQFPEKELEHPMAQEFGCDPDFNAWTKKQNPRPKADDHTLRSCGGHIHVGAEFVSNAEKLRMIRLMDLFLGVPSTLIDKGEQRKILYGKRGAFRPKSYGVEYRTLSNFWIFTDSLRRWAWKNTLTAVDSLRTDFDVDGEDFPILDAIDNNNKDAARFLVAKYNISLPQHA